MDGDRNAQSQSNLAAAFQAILNTRSIETLFQPIFDVRKETIIGFEALSRGPKGSELEMPDRLFYLAHQEYKLSELELLCRERAIERFVSQQLPGKLFLNVSPNTLLDPSHPHGETRHLIAKYGLAASRVVIEVTEQDKVDDGFLLIKTIEHYGFFK